MRLALEANFAKIQILIFSSWRRVFFDLKVLHKNTLISRESNRLKYRSGSGSGSRNLIFNGSVPVQVQDFSKTWVQVQLHQNLKVRVRVHRNQIFKVQVRFRFTKSKF